MRFYISSTFTDLQEHRSAVRRTLQSLGDVEYVGLEYLSASDAPPLETCLRQIANSTVFVLLIGWRYGYIPAGHDKSVVELEYEAAIASGVSVFAYMIDNDYPVPAKFIETGESAERLRLFKERVKQGRLVSFFSTPEDLARQVAISIANFASKSFSEAIEDSTGRPYLEEELRRCKETSVAYETTVNSLRTRLDNLVPAIPIWARRNFAIDTTLCFALMPFQDPFFLVYEDGILPAAKAAGLRGMHAGEIFDNREVIEDVWESICTARLIVADVTGRNPNVFYEMGICHTLGKEVVVLTQNRDDVPFDIRHRRFLEYSPDKLTSLKARLEKTIKNIVVRTTGSA